MKKKNFREISTELKSFVECYADFLKARGSFRRSKLDAILYIEKYATLDLQKETVALMAEQARAFLNKRAEEEVINFLNS